MGYAADSFKMTESIPVSGSIVFCRISYIFARSPASHEAMKLSFQLDTRKAAS
jgi:hypothetical protein